jgi:hypothetical protein
MKVKDLTMKEAWGVDKYHTGKTLSDCLLAMARSHVQCGLSKSKVVNHVVKEFQDGVHYVVADGGASMV